MSPWLGARSCPAPPSSGGWTNRWTLRPNLVGTAAEVWSLLPVPWAVSRATEPGLPGKGRCRPPILAGSSEGAVDGCGTSSTSPVHTRPVSSPKATNHTPKRRPVCHLTHSVVRGALRLVGERSLARPDAPRCARCHHDQRPPDSSIPVFVDGEAGIWHQRSVSRNRSAN